MLTEGPRETGEGKREREEERERRALWWGSALCSRPCLALSPTLHHYSLFAPSKTVSSSYPQKGPTGIQNSRWEHRGKDFSCVPSKIQSPMPSSPWFACIQLSLLYPDSRVAPEETTPRHHVYRHKHGPTM